jgi:hypothetical protein
MPDTRVKRTYNLSDHSVQAVRRLAEARVAPNQDAVVELAIADLERRVREGEDAAAWERAAADPAFTGELDAIDHEMAGADRESWPLT